MDFVLAIETSATQGSIALLEGTSARQCEIVGERVLLLPRRHNEELLAQVDALLVEAGCSTADLAAVAYGSGPGSFTGVRLAAAAALALGWAHQVPTFAIGSAEALTRQAWRVAGTSVEDAPDVLVVLDARVEQVYLTHVRADAAASSPAAATQLVGWRQLGRMVPPRAPFLAVGDAWRDARMPAEFTASAQHVLADLQPQARDVAALAWARLAAGERPVAGAEQPEYLRGADAWC